MNIYMTIFIVLLAVVIVTLGTNLIQLFKESKQLKEAGKTPLTNRNLTVIGFAAAAEIIVCYALMMLYVVADIPTTDIGVFLMFIVAYLLRNVGAYLAAWGLWSIFVKIDQRKLKKELEKEREGAL